MKKKAIIYDLDNTLYPVPAIGEELFKPVFDMIARDHEDDLPAIKSEMMGTPFRIVAKKYNFSEELTKKAIAVQEKLEYNKPIATFKDYQLIKNLPYERFLVTTGFKKMQESKIRNMGISGDFTEIHIVDPTISSKKEVFAGIMQRYNYRPEDVLAVGDDPDSEIKAAHDLGIETVLYDYNGKRDKTISTYYITNYSELKNIFD